MSGWEVGDLALCWRYPTEGVSTPWRVVAGVVYTVAGVYPEDDWVGLDFSEDPAPLEDASWDAAHFIKVTPPEADEFDAEVIDLMLGKPITLEQRDAEYFEKIEAQMRRQMQGDD